MPPTREQLQANIQAMEQQGAPPADVQAYLDGLKGAAPQPAAPQPVAPQAAIPTSMAPNDANFSGERAVTQGFSGFNEGVAKTVGRALDVIPHFAGKAMGYEDVHPVENFMRDSFVRGGEPKTTFERALRTGGNFAGENLTTLVPGMAVATKGVRAAPALAELGGAEGGVMQTIRQAGDNVLNWMAKKPVAAVASDTMGAAVSGATGSAAGDLSKDAGGSPHEQAGATIAGQFLGPAVVAAYSHVSPTALAIKGGAAVAKKAAQMLPEGILPEALRPQGGSFADRQAAKLAYANRETDVQPPEPNWITRQMDEGARARAVNATKVVGSDLEQIRNKPENAASIEEVERLKQQIPGYDPGMAKATNDPALLNLQQKIESQATGNDLRAAQGKADQNATAIRQFADQAVPPTGPHPEDTVVRAGQQRVGNLENDIGLRQDIVQHRIRQQSDALPETDRAATGDRLRQIREGEQRIAGDEVNRLRQAVDPGGGTQVDVNGQQMTVGQALDRRAAINQELRDYRSANSRNVADVQRMRELNDERDALDAVVNRTNAPGLAEYNRYYRDEYVPRFSEGASRNVGRYNQHGYDKNRVASENVPNEFFKPNNISGARQFNRLYGEDGNARQAMTDHALDDLRHTAVDPVSGNLREGAVSRWLMKNERVLNEMPWIREAVDQHNPDQLYRRLAELEGRRRDVGQSTLAKTVGKEPGAAIDEALADWRVARTLRNSVRGNEQAESALTRAVWDRVISRGGSEGLLDGAAIQKFVDENRRSLQHVLTPKHLSDIDTIVRAANVEARLPRPTGAVEQPKSLADKATDAVGLSLPSLLSRWINVNSGRASVKTVGAEVATRVYRSLTNKEIEAAWKEALYNPQVAAQVAEISRNKGATPIQFNRLYNHLLTVGAIDAGEGLPRNREER